jgi:hypothetical protein
MYITVINMRRTSGGRLAEFEVDIGGNVIREFGIALTPDGETVAVPPRGRNGPVVRLSRDAWSTVRREAEAEYDRLVPDDAGLRRVLGEAERDSLEIAGI